MKSVFTPRRVVAVLAVVLVVPLWASVAAGRAGRSAETFEGELLMLHADQFEHDRATQSWALRSARRYIRLDLSNVADADDLAGKRVRVDGTRRNGVVVARRVTGASRWWSTTSLATTPGTRRVAVVLFNFTNDSSQPWSRETARAAVLGDSSSPNAFYGEVSYGQTSLAGDVLGWHTVPFDNSGCRFTEWSTAADAAAGLDPTAYDHVIYAFPRASSCGWTGMGAIRGRQSWINGSMTLRTLTHELGHNLNAHHASSLSCTSGGARVPLSSTCTQSEYGDPFSVMGASTRHQHNWHRAQIGWLPELVTVSATGTHTVAPAELGASPRLVRVPRGDGNYFYLEFRQPFGVYDAFSAGDPAVNGVTVRLAGDVPQIVRSFLLDTTPSTSSFSDAPLAVGQTFTDPLSGIAITTTGVSSSGASVRVSFAGSGEGDTEAPTAPSSLAATATTSSVSLSWVASADNVAVAGYRVYRSGTLVSTTASTSSTDAGLASGATYAYSVVAFDAAGNSGPAASVTVTTLVGPPPPADTIAPTAPTGLTATPGKGKKVVLAWQASSDNVGVAGYRVYRLDALVGDVPGTSYTDSLPGKSPSATYVVVAYDAAGNRSAPSAPVSIALG